MEASDCLAEAVLTAVELRRSSSTVLVISGVAFSTFAIFSFIHVDLNQRNRDNNMLEYQINSAESAINIQPKT